MFCVKHSNRTDWIMEFRGKLTAELVSGVVYFGKIQIEIVIMWDSGHSD